jgi:hypothetical protein
MPARSTTTDLSGAEEISLVEDEELASGRVSARSRERELWSRDGIVFTRGGAGAYSQERQGGFLWGLGRDGIVFSRGGRCVC